MTESLTVDPVEYARRKAKRQRDRRAQALTDIRTEAWTDAETEIALRTDIHLIEKMVMLQRTEFDICNRISKIAYGIPMPCLNCQTVFMSSASCTRDGVTRYHKFCSKACQHEASRTLTPINCGYCQKLYRPRVYKERFCSRKCMGDSKRGKPLIIPPRTHCKKGHQFTPDNTRILSGNVRTCAICWKVNQEKVNERRRSGRPAKPRPDNAARLARWAELGKTWEAVRVLAAEIGMSEKSLIHWLRKQGDPAPNGRVYSPRRYKSHCKNGHELTPENVYINPSRGARACRACMKINSRKSEERIKLRPRPTHCKNGHEFSAENTSTARKGYRVCRVCPKEHAQRQRESKQPGSGDQLRQLVREVVSK